MVLTAITLEITPCPLWASPGGSHLAMHQNHLCCFKIPDAWFLLRAQWASALSERKGPGKSISHIWFWCQFVIVKMCFVLLSFLSLEHHHLYNHSEQWFLLSGAHLSEGVPEILIDGSWWTYSALEELSVYLIPSSLLKNLMMLKSSSIKQKRQEKLPNEY